MTYIYQLYPLPSTLYRDVNENTKKIFYVLRNDCTAIIVIETILKYSIILTENKSNIMFLMIEFSRST